MITYLIIGDTGTFGGMDIYGLILQYLYFPASPGPKSSILL